MDVEPHPVVLTGANGAGKTNLLEALSLLVPGRGLRRAKLTDICRSRSEGASEPGAWAVAARIEAPGGPCDLGTAFGTSESAAAERRSVKIDGAIGRPQAALAEVMSAQWLTPQMDRLFQEGSGARRRFLDRLVYGWDPAHAGRVSAYEQAMRERLRLLRDGAPVDPAWLAAQEQTMAARGIAVAAARADVIARLAGPAAENWGPFPGARLALEGNIETWLSEGPALEAEDRFREALAAERDRDAQYGRTHTGPHRTDLLVHHGPKDEVAARCSTGEQKALLIALVLANARVRAAEDGGVPLLLLDEVAAHLDAARRDALFAGLVDMGAQAWLTGTDEAIFEPLGGKAQFFNVADGRLTPTN